MKVERNPELDSKIKALSNEIAVIKEQREELHRKYVEDDFLLGNSMTELIKKRHTIIKKKKYEDKSYESNR